MPPKRSLRVRNPSVKAVEEEVKALYTIILYSYECHCSGNPSTLVPISGHGPAGGQGGRGGH